MTLQSSKARVSVVIPCYNAAEYISETIVSALAQSHAPIEVLVIDDGSDDNSGIVATGIDSRVRVIRQANSGEAAARNRGIDEARGDWIAFLDADDRWEPTKLQKQLASIPGDDVICVHTGVYFFGTKTGLRDHPPAVISNRYVVETMLFTPTVNTSSALVRSGLPVRFPLWTQQGADMLYFVELSQLGQITFVDEPLTGYRMHPGQLTRRTDAWARHFQGRFRWIDEKSQELGAQRAEKLRDLLRAQILDWLQLAKWSRRWDQYESLKAYALTIDWKGTVPFTLRKPLMPRPFYSAKDWLDRLVGRI